MYHEYDRGGRDAFPAMTATLLQLHWDFEICGRNEIFLAKSRPETLRHTSHLHSGESKVPPFVVALLLPIVLLISQALRAFLSGLKDVTHMQ